MPIYHIASKADWQKASEEGEYTTSTRGRTLEQQGFIHAGDAHQVVPVANMIYGSDTDLIVLVIDTDRLQPPLRYEEVPGWDTPFPHIYGPLNVNAVTDTIPLERGSDGKFAFSFEETS
jgi:uncharacterized protein (DUF952 family)